MQQTLCDKYGFDKEGRERRLALLGFGVEDIDLAQQLQTKVLAPNQQAIIEALYEFITHKPDMAAYVDAPETLEALKHNYHNYLSSLGVDYSSFEYFENRLHIGVTHARNGLPLGLYLAVNRLLVDLILRCFPPEIINQPEHCLNLSRYVNRVVNLDMSLAIEIYHRTEVQDLKTSVHALLNEREDLTTQVQRDALTQLASRRYLLDVLDKAVDEASAGESHLTIAMADLDHFKQVNDTLGHLVGDRVLKDVAQRLSKSVREQDLIGRYGGEEFLLIFPDTSLAVAQQVAERIREHIASTPIHLPEHTIPITISIGLTHYEPGDTLESFLQRADQAMYAAKQAGRNCVMVI
jgi:diguanylate cyclase (GGDEF)-like protein